MFIKRCARKYKKKEYHSWWLAESYRDNGKIKCKYHLNITNFTPSQRKNLLEVLKNPNASVLPNLKRLFHSGCDYGSVVFFLYLMHKIGIIEVLAKKLCKKSLSLITAVLLNRILKPTSKLEAIRWIKDTVFPHFSSLKDKEYHESRVYEAMDEVYDNLPGIMEEFYHLLEGKPLFLLYDITSVYFEGKKVKIGKKGYSRDKRPDRPQVLLGLVLDENGFPVHFEIFEGNVKDETTVGEVVRKVRGRFGIDKAIFIGDRGMVTAENVGKIIREGLGYIMALRNGEAKELLKEKGIQMELFDQKLPVTIWEDGQERKYVLCGSEYRRERDEKVLEALLSRGREALEKVQRMVEAGRLKKYEKVIRRAEKKLTESGTGKYFDFSYQEGKFEIIKRSEEIKKSKMLCGYYVLETSEVGMPVEEVEAHYKDLQQVEQCFRDLKDLLDIRPVYHWVDRRVKTHIFLCLMAQVVLRHTRKALKEAGWLGKGKENTLERFIDSLATIKLGKFFISGKEIFQVQEENPVGGILKQVFEMQPFEFTRDREACSI